MLNFQFVVNNKVEIVWDDGAYRCHVQDTSDEDIAVNLPVKDGKYLPLRAGEMVQVIYYHEKDTYQFYTVVTGRKIDRIALILLKMPEKVERVQRRDSVRVSCFAEIPYIRIKEDTSNEQLQELGTQKENFNTAILVDLSGGGMRIKTSEEVKRGEQIMAFLPLDTEEMVVRGKLIRVEKEEDKRNTCGVNFLDLENKQVEKIMQYIFKLMREQRRKGLKGE